MLPRVAVIIVTFNGRHYLPDLFSSLQVVDYPDGYWRLVIVDNASSDGSADEVARGWPGTVLLRQTSNLGFAAASNVGLRYAIDHGFDFAYLLNQDTVVTPAFVREAVTVAQAEPSAAAVQSKLLLHGTNLVNSRGNELHFLGFGYAGGHRQPDAPIGVREIAYPSGAAVLLRLEVLRRVGLLDESLFMYHEDLELGWRLWLAGYRSLLAPQSVVYHKYEFSRSIAKYYWMERNRYLVVLTHYRLGSLLLIWPLSLVVDLGLLVQSLRGGYLRQLVSAQCCVLQPRTWRWVLQRRRRLRPLRRVSDRELIRRFVSEIKFQDLPETSWLRFGNMVMRAYWQMVRPLVRW